MASAHPECPNDHEMCRVSVSKTIAQPVIEWAPVYDGTGKMTNQDPNTFITTHSCAICGMSWAERRTGDEVVVEDLTPTQPIEPNRSATP